MLYMAIDLLSITPHQVSRDMRGYSVFFYGEAKSGKTTTASKFPRSLLLAFEKGYNALPGVMAQPINSWSEFKQVLKQLKDQKVKERFETVIIDTVDIAYDYCTKYICDNAQRPDGGYGVDTVSDIPYGKGYGMISKEFDTALRSIVMMDYGIVLISHATDKTFKDENGEEYNRIVPTLDKRANNIVARMADIIGYTRPINTASGNTKTVMFMRGTTRYEAGSRFKYTPDYIDFNYQNLVKAIGEAIDKQAEEDGTEYFTDTRQNLYEDTTLHLDFDDLMNKFNTLVSSIPVFKDANSQDDNENSSEAAAHFREFWAPRIGQITDKYLGRGNKVGNCSREQVEALSLIVEDLEELINENR